MVMLIIAIALVSILVAVIMVMSALNLQMKYTERKAKSNFYTAEIAIEQIRAGLELKVSEAAKTAYESIQQNYAQSGENELTPEERSANFRTIYALALKEALKDAADSNKYDMDILESFIDETHFKIGTGAGDNTQLESTQSCKMDALSTGLVLYGVKVTYTDDEDFQSIVETDFCLLIPDLHFTQFSVMPDLFNYSLVADEGIEGGSTGSSVVFEDNVYAGKDGILIKGAGADWQFKNMDRVVCRGTVEVKEAAKLTVKSNKDFTVSLWANDILVNGATAVLNGRTYLSDDLTLKGKNSKVTLEKEYYGYGNGAKLKTDGSLETNPSDNVQAGSQNSSAMLINGLNSTLDMKKLNKLVLAGRAAIATSGDEVEKPADGNSELPGVKIEENMDIPLGESIGIKSNQLAYLVPAECIGVYEGEALIGKNPMSAADYIQLLEYEKDETMYPGFEEVSLNTTVEKLGKPLNDYVAGGSGEDQKDQAKQQEPKKDNSKKESFRRIFQQVDGEIVVYYYLLLDEKNGARYFKDYYEAEKEKLDGYMKQYTNRLLVNDKLSRLVLGGNMLTYDGEELLLRQNDAVLTPEEINSLTEEINNDYRVFAALSSKLLTDYGSLTDEEKTRTVFENLIDASTLPGGKQEYGLEVEGGARTLEAYITSGNFNFPGDVMNPGNKKNVCLIVAGGDVTVSDDFSGLILAKGKVKITDSGKIHIEGNREDLIKMLQKPTIDGDDSSETILQKYFKESKNYVLDGTSIKKPEEGEAEDTGEKSEAYLDLTDYVQYQNWKKR